jgi:hypothetical protein
MTTYLDEKRRRIEQFAHWLRLMGLRRHKVVKGDCFLIFDESAPEDSETPCLRGSAAIRVACPANGAAGLGEDDPFEVSSSEWSPAEPFRYIQFAFMRDCFYLELPNNTVFPEETEIILQQRRGFYYAKSRRDLRWVRSNWQDIVKWEPLQKVYLYRDEDSAAEDMAFILFEVWKFPVDWCWYIKASSFHTEHRFEQGKPLD